MRVTDILKELGIPFCPPGQHHHVREGWIGVDCPWCRKPVGEKGKWKLGIDISSGRCNCWTCGGHSLEHVLATLSSSSVADVRPILQSVRFTRLPEVPKPEGRLKIPDGISPLQDPHKRYLQWRGLDPETMERLWKVSGIGIHSKFSWRLFIPVYTDNEIVTWTTRSIGRNGGYISAKPEQSVIRLKNTLYGIDLARTTVIICEGPADVWKVGPGAVATFGVNVTSAQVSILGRFPRRVVCFDSDETGKREGERLASLLSAFPGESIHVELDAEDPGSASVEEIRRLRRTMLGET